MIDSFDFHSPLVVKKTIMLLVCLKC